MVKRPIIYSIIAIFLIGLYLFRFYTVRYTFQEGDRVRISGALSEEPSVVAGRQKLTLGRIRVFVDRFPEYHYGQQVVAEGEAAKGRGGWYLKNPSVGLPVSRHPARSAFTPLRMRERILSLYQKYLPEPHSALLSGIVLGTKSSLNPELVEGLRKTGTLHIVVASGTNIAIFAGSTLSILAVVLQRQQAVFIALLVIWAYVLLVGWQPPIVRAAVMGSIAFAAQALGREFAAWRALFISGYLLALAQPLWLFDIGFQLSFLATAGIIAFGKTFWQALVFVPKIFRENLSTTLAAQIGVWPLLLFSFGQIALIGPLVNVFVLPVVPAIMAAGAAVAALGLAWDPLGQAGAWFVWILLEYFIRVIAIFSRG